MSADLRRATTKRGSGAVDCPLADEIVEVARPISNGRAELQKYRPALAATPGPQRLRREAQSVGRLDVGYRRVRSRDSNLRTFRTCIGLILCLVHESGTSNQAICIAASSFPPRT